MSDRKRRGIRRIAWVAEAEVAVLGFLVWLILSLIRRTVTLETHGAEELERHWREGKPSLIAFWHGRSIMLPFFYAGRGACIMNSTHRDGEIVTRALARFGVRAVRGSSSRSAVSGALGLVRAFRKGEDLALIPDGPRGPAAIAKPGVVEIARQTGAPLFPVSISASRSLRMTGWDRMMIPLPGARLVMVVGEVVQAEGAGRVRRDREERERLRLRLEEALADASRTADRLVGRREEES